MKATRRVTLLCLGLAPLLALSLVAQTPGNPPLPAPSPAAQLPQLPPVRSPVDFFRELLTKDPADQRASLTNRPPESQKLILAKIKEYQSLNPEQRELRLRVTELHYFLVPLMNSPATNRAGQLALIPTDVRKLVEDRLQQWDALSPEAQRELLQNEATLRTLSDLANQPAAQQKESVVGLNPAQKTELEAGIRRWQALPDTQRHAIIERFNQFFDLTAPEKEKALSTLSDTERRQLDRTLVTFEKLSPMQRAKCVRAFDRFAKLSTEDRQRFLRGAERWTRMSPSQRQLWRDLVYGLSHEPPMPPGADQPPRPPSKQPPFPTVPNRMTATTN
jgi:hypothetical protein